MNGKKRNVGGKPPKPDKASHQVMVRFNDEEYARFLAMYEQSGVYAKAVFIKARVFGAEFRVLKVDKTLVDYYTRLSSLLYKLEKMTVELAGLSRQILALTHEFQQQWLPKLT